MKRFLCLVTAVCLLLGCALAEDKLITQEEATELAKIEFLKATGLEEAEIENFAVITSLIYPEIQKPYYSCLFGYIHAAGRMYEVQIAADTGEVILCMADESVPEEIGRALEQEKLNEAVKSATSEWEERLGPHEFWDYRDKAEFFSVYGSEPGETASQYSVKILGKPLAGDLIYEQALDYALSELKSAFHLTDEKIAEYKVDAMLTDMDSEDTSGDKRQWWFILRSPEADTEGEYRGIYQVSVYMPSTRIFLARLFTVEDLMNLGFSENTAYGLTELGSLCRVKDGGRFFHIDRDCRGVMPEDKPMEEFLTGLLEVEPYKSLLPCSFCVPQ